MTTQDKIQEAMTYLDRAKDILEEGYRDVSSEEDWFLKPSKSDIGYGEG